MPILPLSVILFLNASLLSVLPPTDGATAAPLKERVVDVLNLKSNEKLQGAFWGKSAAGDITIFVRRDWLKTNYPKLLEQEDKQSIEKVKKSYEQVRDRTKLWIGERQKEKVFVAFLEDEVERMERKLKEEQVVDKKPFVVIEVESKNVQKWIAQTAQRRELLLSAWKNGLRSPETRSAKSISAELAKLGNNAPKVDFTSMFPIRPQDDNEWRARMALVEYSKIATVHFQGTNDFVMHVDEANPKPAKLDDILGGIGKSALGGLGLDQQPAPKRKPSEVYQPAFKYADEQGRTGVRITQADYDLAAQRVTVTTRFLARDADGNWRYIWSYSEQASFAQSRPELEKRIESDPQLKSALDAVKALGLGGSGDPIRTAIRAGAAVMAGLETANEKFAEFLSTHSRKLDSPPITVGEAVP